MRKKKQIAHVRLGLLLNSKNSLPVEFSSSWLLGEQNIYAAEAIDIHTQLKNSPKVLRLAGHAPIRLLLAMRGEAEKKFERQLEAHFRGTLRFLAFCLPLIKFKVECSIVTNVFSRHNCIIRRLSTFS